MFSNRLAIAALAGACIVAAGAGGYLASRQQATTPVAVSAAAPTSTTEPSTPASSAPRPVQETEAVVGDTAVKPAEPSAPTPAARTASTPSSKRSETSASARTTARSEKAGSNAQATPPPPPLTQTWPASATQSTSPAPSAAPNETSGSTARSDERAAPEATRASDPPAKQYEELVVSADSVIGLKTETAISSELARVEDVVQARVSRDVRVGDKVAIPEGTRAIGSVVQVERGGKFKERARLGIRFHTLVLADGTRVPISTDTLYREGDAPTSAQKIGGGAVIGTILGAIVGGGKGAAIGGAAGAGAGTAATMASDRSTATFPAGSPMTVRVLSPVTITVEQK
jgi:type IV secretory pathway VirB10-like protein